MRTHLSHNSWAYYWNWHTTEPCLPLAEMLDVVEKQREEEDRIAWEDCKAEWALTFEGEEEQEEEDRIAWEEYARPFRVAVAKERRDYIPPLKKRIRDAQARIEAALGELPPGSGHLIDVAWVDSMEGEEGLESYAAEREATAAHLEAQRRPSPLEAILALLESPVTYRYEPVVRETWKVTPEDIDLIQFYSTMPSSDPEALKAWEAGWAARTHGLAPIHLRRLEMRGLTLRIEHPPEGSDEWRRIVIGISDAEYDEMDRVGFLLWDECYQANEKRARLFSWDFLTLSQKDQVQCARWYKNAAAWGVFEGLLSEEEEKAIRSEVENLDRTEDELDRREHEWDD